MGRLEAAVPFDDVGDSPQRAILVRQLPMDCGREVPVTLSLSPEVIWKVWPLATQRCRDALLQMKSPAVYRFPGLRRLQQVHQVESSEVGHLV